MKAFRYLQKVGAVPGYEKWDLLMSLVTIVDEHFSVETTVEPDLFAWVQKSETDEEFEDKCNAIFFATSGDVRVLYPFVANQETKFLQELIENLLDIRVMLDCLEKGELYSPENDDTFVDYHNKVLGLKGRKKFPSRPSVLQFYFSGNLVETGQNILSSYAGTQTDFLEQMANIHSDFLKMATRDMGLVVGKVKFESEGDNPYEGGYQAKVQVGLSDPPDQECTLHWAPWPCAKTNSISPIIQELCFKFSEKGNEGWFSKVYLEEG